MPGLCVEDAVVVRHIISYLIISYLLRVGLAGEPRSVRSEDLIPNGTGGRTT